MKATELRIGNLIGCDIQTLIVKAVNDETVICHTMDGKPYVLHLEDVYGLKLTEEWLLKFGFTLITSDCESPSDWYYRHDNLTGSIDNLTWKYTHQHGLKLKYVHQLQNLYFALTGEELKLV
jgi:hypothetical protein